MRRKYCAIGVGGALRLLPVGRADQHHHALLRRLDHMIESLLHDRVLLLRRQQRQDIGVGHDALHQPQIAVMAEQQRGDQQPEQPELPEPMYCKCASSSALMRCSPLWIAENTNVGMIAAGFVDGDFFHIVAAFQRQRADGLGQRRRARLERHFPLLALNTAIHFE